MSIVVKCENCRAAFKVNDVHAGKRSSCPKCGHAIQVPSSQSTEPGAIKADDTSPQPPDDVAAFQRQLSNERKSQGDSTSLKPVPVAPPRRPQGVSEPGTQHLTPSTKEIINKVGKSRTSTTQGTSAPLTEWLKWLLGITIVLVGTIVVLFGLLMVILVLLTGLYFVRLAASAFVILAGIGLLLIGLRWTKER